MFKNANSNREKRVFTVTLLMLLLLDIPALLFGSITFLSIWKTSTLNRNIRQYYKEREESGNSPPKFDNINFFHEIWYQNYIELSLLPLSN